MKTKEKKTFNLACYNLAFYGVLSTFSYHTLIDMTISVVIRLKSIIDCVKYVKIIRRLQMQTTLAPGKMVNRAIYKYNNN